MTRARRRTVRREVVFEHASLVLRLDTERDASGREHTYILGSGPPLAFVVPLWPDGTVTLNSQRRHGLPKRSLELPGGHVDRGETALAGARRELREETGVRARRMSPVVDFLVSAKLQQRVHVFLAQGLSAGPPALEDDEEIDAVRIPFGEAVLRALDGRMQHGPSILGLLAVHARLRMP